MSATTTCPKCATLYEETSEEQANAPGRLCMTCWMRARTEENIGRPSEDSKGDELAGGVAYVLLIAGAIVALHFA